MPGPGQEASWDEVIAHEAQKSGLSPKLALAVANVESGMKSGATSPKGAMGLFQLMPDTAKGLGVDASDPVQNIRGGITYLKQLLDQHGGNVEKTLQAYNWGPGNVARGGTPPTETTDYVSRVLSRLDPQQAPTPEKLAPLTLKDTVMGIGQPPPGKTVGKPTKAGGPSVLSPQKGMLASMAEGIDPRTPTGRRNLAGGAGAMLGGAAVVGTAPVSVPLAAAAASVLGATGGGMLAESGNLLAGTTPPADTDLGIRRQIFAAGGEQGLYDLAGQAFMWPVRAIGNRVMASSVGKFASEHLNTALEGASASLKSAREMARDALTSANESAAALKERAGQSTKNVVAQVEKHFNKVATPPPSAYASTAGRDVNAVLAGPAKSARDEMGQLVEATAKTGPAVDIKPLKAEAQRILAEEIRPSKTAFPSKVAGPEDTSGAGYIANMRTDTPAAKAQAEAAANAVKQAEEEQANALLQHPAMKTLGRILNAEDSVPFEAAHGFKRELDDAIGTAWDRSVKSRVTNITKTLRGTLRDALSVHEPYNVATKAYQDISPLWNKGLAPQLRRAAADAPEAVIRLIKPNNPTKLGMLRDLLITQSEKGGGGKEGQAAWDSVRSAWTHQNILKGGLQNLDKNLGKMDPEFSSIMYGDASGKAVLDNLHAINGAYQSALRSGDETVAKVIQQGKTTIAQTKIGNRQLIESNAKGVEHARQDLAQFAGSTMSRAANRDVAVDIAKGVLLGPTSTWGALSISRLLHGPRAGELMQYMAYSPTATQAWVKFFNSPITAPVTADFLRATGILNFMKDSVKAKVGTAPPRASTAVGAPPPQ